MKQTKNVEGRPRIHRHRPTQYDNQFKERALKSLARKAKELGLQLVFSDALGVCDARHSGMRLY